MNFFPASFHKGCEITITHGIQGQLKINIKIGENVDRIKQQDYRENWNVKNWAIESSMVIKVELPI